MNASFPTPTANGPRLQPAGEYIKFFLVVFLRTFYEIKNWSQNYERILDKLDSFDRSENTSNVILLVWNWMGFPEVIQSTQNQKYFTFLYWYTYIYSDGFHVPCLSVVFYGTVMSKFKGDLDTVTRTVCVLTTRSWSPADLWTVLGESQNSELEPQHSFGNASCTYGTEVKQRSENEWVQCIGTCNATNNVKIKKSESFIVRYKYYKGIWAAITLDVKLLIY